jgi:DNA-binding transcriptional MerR regulator
MPRKRTLDEIKERDFLRMIELAELCGVRYSTVKYYSELGLLPYEQKGERLAKYYPTDIASQRIKAILKMREEGKSVSEITGYFASKQA